ncbi:unnamed protein product [Boreogadus saida]
MVTNSSRRKADDGNNKSRGATKAPGSRRRRMERGVVPNLPLSTADCTDHRYIPRSPAAADALAAERDKRWEEASPPFFSD